MNPDPDRPAAAPRWALACLSLTMLMPALDTSIANVALPALARSYGASFPAIQWVVLAYLLAIATLIVGAGRLGDLLGRRRLLLGGIVLFTAASAACGLAPSLALLIAARALQGLGAALMMALTLAMVGEIVPKARTGSAMGLLGTMSAVGTTLGPALGGLLIAGFGWRTIFLVNLPLGLLNLVLALRTLPADRPAAGPRPRFDAVGTALLALSLAAYALAMTIGHGGFGRLNLALLAAALGVGAVFVAAQQRAAAPLLRLAMLREAGLGAGLARNLLVSTVMMATLVVGPFYLSRGLGLDAARVGLVMSAGPLVAALAGVPAGRLVDRFGARALGRAGLAGLAAGLLALALLPAWLGVAGYLAAIAVVTADYALFQAANNTAIMGVVRAEERGVVSGLLNLTRQLGGITGAAVLGAVFAGVAGASDLAAAHPAAVAAGMRATFILAALLILLALAAPALPALRRAPASPGPSGRPSGTA